MALGALQPMEYSGGMAGAALGACRRRGCGAAILDASLFSCRSGPTPCPLSTRSNRQIIPLVGAEIVLCVAEQHVLRVARIQMKGKATFCTNAACVTQELSRKA